jgi:lysozyme
MQASNSIRAFIKNAEGLRLQVYNDGANNLTIGYGHKLPANSPIKQIAQQEADNYFASDIVIAENRLRACLKISVTQNEFDACISFIFNVGAAAFENSSILLYINKGLKIEAASWFCRWCHEGKTAVLGLLERRLKETCIYLGLSMPGMAYVPIAVTNNPISPIVLKPQEIPVKEDIYKEIAMNLIGEVETAMAFAQALQKLTTNGALQADVAALMADVTQLKAIYEDVKAKVENIFAQLGPEVQALLPKTTTTTTVTTSASVAK